jgi:hypothetical protein
MTPHEFIRKWKPVALNEQQTAQEHFIDLCRLVKHPTPIEDDPAGERYCFEKGALKASGNPGFADVWKKGYFAFEYKKKKKNLGEALKQLSQYAWNLENPPLNVVCDTNLIRIVTAWTNTPSKTFDLTLDDLADPEKFAILHAVFHDPEKLRGHMTREMLTKEAADKFSGLAERLQSRGHAPEAVAHFVMQLVFCFFAEDVRLLPEGFFRKALRQLNMGGRHRHAKALLDARPAVTAQGRAQARPHSEGRRRPDPSHRRGGALATDRPGSMDLRAIPHQRDKTDPQPGAAGPWIPEALGAAASSCARRGCRGCFQKDFPAVVAAVAAETGGKPIEIWFADEALIGQKNKITRR